MMKHEAVLFDLDNTLLDRRASFRKFAEAFVDARFPDDPPDVREGRIALMTALDKDGYGGKRALYEGILAAWGRPEDAQALIAGHFSAFDPFTTPDPDMIEVLDALRGRCKLGLVTNGTPEGQNAKIDRLGIRDRFDAILVSGELGIHKPDARIFRMCCEALGVAPERAVYVGDHYENDVLGAQSAGLHPIWYPRDPVVVTVDVPIIPRLRGLLNRI